MYYMHVPWIDGCILVPISKNKFYQLTSALFTSYDLFTTTTSMDIFSPNNIILISCENWTCSFICAINITVVNQCSNLQNKWEYKWRQHTPYFRELQREEDRVRKKKREKQQELLQFVFDQLVSSSGIELTRPLSDRTCCEFINFGVLLRVGRK